MLSSVFEHCLAAGRNDCGDLEKATAAVLHLFSEHAALKLSPSELIGHELYTPIGKVLRMLSGGS